jgi:glutamate racemase
MGRIGIFDSGYGGLSIAKSIVKKLPQYDYIYLGDSANAPYGPRPKDEVQRLTTAAVDKLFGMGCELIIIACNSASAQALRKIQQQHLPKHWPDKRVLGVLIPAVEEAVAYTNKPIGIMATLGTVSSGSFVEEIQKLVPDAQVFQQACPDLAPLIEAGEHASPELHQAVERYTRSLMSHRVASVILGCTHYGLIKDAIAAKMPGVAIINEGPVVAQKLDDYLHRYPEIEKRLSKNARRQFFSTHARSFNSNASDFFGSSVVAEQI